MIDIESILLIEIADSKFTLFAYSTAFRTSFFQASGFC